MAQDSFEEKTESATPKRREEAHSEGQVPRSQELTTAIMILGSALVWSTVGATLVIFLRDELGGMLMRAGTIEITPNTVVRLLQERCGAALLATGSFIGSMAAIALLVVGLQARGVLTSKSLGPNWGRLSPLANISRMWGLKAVGELIKSFVKMTIIGIGAYNALNMVWPTLITLAQRSPLALGTVIAQSGMKLLLWAGGCYLALGVLDYAFEVFQHERRLRMSKNEIRQEMKHTEGDPMIKQRIRALGRQRLRKLMLANVKKAHVVIANPTHRAIALQYDPKSQPAPLVLAMGERKLAERIKKIAYEHGIPVIENRPLAKALIATAQVNQIIPAALYTAVAEVLAFALQKNRQRFSAWTE